MIYKKLSFLAVVALFFISFTAQATHWRFGQLTWKPAAAANTAEFTLTAAFRLNGNYGLPGTPVVGDVITEFQGGTGLSFGDGSSTGTLQFQVISVYTEINHIRNHEKCKVSIFQKFCYFFFGFAMSGFFTETCQNFN